MGSAVNKALDIFIERQDTYFASMDLLERRTDDGGYLITLPTTLLEAGYLVLELSTDLGVIDSKQPAGIIFDNFRWLPLGKKHPTRYDCLFNYFDPEKEGDTEGSLFYDTENYAVHLWQSEDASDEEVNKKEVEYILKYKSNNTSIGYNKWPKSKK